MAGSWYRKEGFPAPGFCIPFRGHSVLLDGQVYVLLTLDSYFSAEVIRTRLREEGTKYKAFIQTARLVAREEGYLAFYRGLFAQLIRQIPNTAIVLSTYELIVYLLEDRGK